jgi:hypothetical protein
MYMPAMEGCVASCFIDSSSSAAWFIPRPIFLVWSTSARTPSASRRLPSASWSAAACMPAIFCDVPAALPPAARRLFDVAAKSVGRRAELLLHLVERRGELGHGPAGATDLVANLGKACRQLVGTIGERVEVVGSVADLCRCVLELGADCSGLEAELGLIERLAGGSRDAAHPSDIGQLRYALRHAALLCCSGNDIRTTVFAAV